MRILVAACVSASLLPLMLTVGGGGCSSSSGSCAPEGTVTVSVTNQVDSENNFVCDAKVTIASTGGSAQALAPQGLDGSTENCVYVVNVPAGSYTLTANADGYQTAMSFITVQEVGCVTSSPSETIALIPTMGESDGGSDDDADVIRDAATE